MSNDWSSSVQEHQQQKQNTSMDHFVFRECGHCHFLFLASAKALVSFRTTNVDICFFLGPYVINRRDVYFIGYGLLTFVLSRIRNSTLFSSYWSWDSFVGIATGYGLGGPGSIPDR
jgi:hypothetical protein